MKSDLPANAPKISVVMSVYNGEDYVAEAIDSVLAQTFDDFEFVIVNDGSNDGTGEILSDYAARDSRIRVISQENAGVTAATCTGCDAARGEYIARMDADDISMPTRFEKQIALLEGDASLVAVIGDVEHFSDDGTISNVARLRGDMRLVRFYNCFCNHIGGHGFLTFRRDAYEQIGGYDPSFRFALDYDIYARLLDVGEFGNVPEIVYRYRTGHDNISKLKKDEQAHHSLRTTLREFKKMTGEDISKSVATVLLNFWWGRPADLENRSDHLAASNAMRKAARAFFPKHPDLRQEEYEAYKSIAARWWWRTKQVPPSYLIYRAIFLYNMLLWGTKALWVRPRGEV